MEEVRNLELTEKEKRLKAFEKRKKAVDGLCKPEAIENDLQRASRAKESARAKRILRRIYKVLDNTSNGSIGAHSLTVAEFDSRDARDIRYGRPREKSIALFQVVDALESKGFEVEFTPINGHGNNGPFFRRFFGKLLKSEKPKKTCEMKVFWTV